jgi:hypothetical protein
MSAASVRFHVSVCVSVRMRVCVYECVRRVGTFGHRAMEARLEIMRFYRLGVALSPRTVVQVARQSEIERTPPVWKHPAGYSSAQRAITNQSAQHTSDSPTPKDDNPKSNKTRTHSKHCTF